MSSSIALSPPERNTLLDYYRAHPDPRLRLRAHIVLLLADGHTWATITAVLFCSSRTIARWQRRFHDGGAPPLLSPPPRAPPPFPHFFAPVVGGLAPHAASPA